MPTVIEIRDFRSPFAALLTNPEETRRERFADAAKYVKDGMTLHVAENGVWSGSFEPNTYKVGNASCTHVSVSSYEKIGYHTGSDWFLQGFLLSGGKVFFHGFRSINGEVIL